MVSKAETLLAPSSIRIYGRVVVGLSIDLTGARTELGANKFLREQFDPLMDRYDLTELEKKELRKEIGPWFARIYGYSYLGQYQALSRAALFLVHGKGELACPPAPIAQSGRSEFEIDPPDGENLRPDTDKSFARFATGSSGIDWSGVAAKDWEFAKDLRVWEYDRADFSMRLDIDSGSFERLLIDAEERADMRPYFGTSRTRLRGTNE